MHCISLRGALIHYEECCRCLIRSCLDSRNVTHPRIQVDRPTMVLPNKICRETWWPIASCFANIGECVRCRNSIAVVEHVTRVLGRRCSCRGGTRPRRGSVLNSVFLKYPICASECSRLDKLPAVVIMPDSGLSLCKTTRDGGIVQRISMRETHHGDGSGGVQDWRLMGSIIPPPSVLLVVEPKQAF